MSQTPPVVTDATFKQIFEKSASGAAILDDLVAKFGKNPYVPGGADAARQTDFNAGSNEVVQYILRRINRANGVNDEPQETTGN